MMERSNSHLLADILDRCRVVSKLAADPTGHRDQEVLDQFKHILAFNNVLRRRCNDAGLFGQNDSVHTQAQQQKCNDVLQGLRAQLDILAQSLSDTLEDVHSSFIAPRKKLKTASLGLPTQLPAPVDVLSYAHKLRYTTFARAGIVSLPPAPQQAQMYNSTLYKYSQEHPVLPDPLVKAPLPAPAAPAPAAATAPSLLGMEVPPMPPGWKPGDPVPDFPEGYQLPLDMAAMPPMPPGWKPGDPIPLPPGLGMMDLGMAARPAPEAPAADEDMSQPAPAPPPSAPRIDLSFILNPDMEVADDYSSDEDSDDDY
mmetsp:Transcript_17305/g.37339  ORF Transcript_17305/g.37339 Transcript_17305/m.37339 type:complete len:312 (+) Transcript_17305:3-938(+)